jgi:hypothetical protein
MQIKVSSAQERINYLKIITTVLALLIITITATKQPLRTTTMTSLIK